MTTEAASSSLPPGLALSISRVLDLGPSTSAGGAINEIDIHSRPPSLTERLAQRFRDPASVSPASIDRAEAKMRASLASIDAEIDMLTAALRKEQSSPRLAEAGGVQIAVKHLFDQLDKIRAKAASSETTVREITGDIRTLDTAKNNLVGSITALKRLQMLESGADQLEILTGDRNFKEAAQALQAAKALQAPFKSYMGVERVATVWKKIAEAQQQLKTAAMEEYETYFLRGTSTPIRATSLPDAALALDSIGTDAVTSLLDWYCGLQLREYRRIFRATDEAGQLDNVARRFAWFRRVIKQHEEEHAGGFLESWRVARALTARFADVTREDIKSVLIREKARLQVSVLLEALGATMEYEQQTSKRYNGPFSEIMAANPKPTSTGPSGITMAVQAPADSISSVFEPYLGLFVEAQDRALAELMANYRRQGATIPATSGEDNSGSTAGPSVSAAPTEHHTVLPSSTELFYFYRQTLEQCARLSNREPFRDLCLVFRRYLRTYAEEVLRSALFKPEVSTSRRSTSTDNRASVNDLQKWCLVLNTADYCANTCQQLEQRLKERIHADFSDDVTFEPERECFQSLVAGSVQILTREVELCLEPALNKMMRPMMPWAQIAEVHGKSEYVDDFGASLEAVAVVVRQDIDNKRYARSWADRVVNASLTRFTSCVLRLRPLRKVAAEQLMIDLYEIRTMLVDLPQFSPSEAASTMGASYVRNIDRLVSRVETLLRLVMVSIEDINTSNANSVSTWNATTGEPFVREYVRVIGDRSISNFQKVLELKGLRRAETHALADLFMHITSELHPDEVAETSFLSALDIDPPGAGAPITPLPNLNFEHLGGAGAGARAPYAIRTTSGSGPGSGAATPAESYLEGLGLGSPDRARSPGAEGGGGRVFGTGKFVSMFGGLGMGGMGIGRRQ